MKTLALLVLGAAATVSPASGKGVEEISLPPEDVFLLPSSLPGYGYAVGICATCHSADYIRYQPPTLPPAAWKAEVAKMKKVYGAPIPDEAMGPIAEYLARTYGTEASTKR